LGENNGMEFFKIFPNPDFQVVFTTAYSEYAVEAFGTAAIDYLLKPIDIDELKRAVSRVENKMGENMVDLKLENESQQENKIKLKTNKGIEIIKYKEIVRCEAQGSYTKVFLSQGRDLLISKNLKTLEKETEGYNFLRVHRSHLVNLTYVEEVSWGNDSSIILTTKESIPVSQVSKEDLFKLI
jgi:two-component system, LytTR family, response regulator